MNNDTEKPQPYLDELNHALTESDVQSNPVKVKRKNKSKNKSEQQAQIGSRRGVETLFRNSYRAHLDLIALAATKANIMISINGLILSFLFISEAFVMSEQPLLGIPTSIFLVTCFFSVVFAILSVLPERNKGLWKVEDFVQDRANLLVFEDYTDLTESEYLPTMRGLLQSSPRIYDSMVKQLYFLGAHANKRVKLLHLSYGIFIVGLALSILTSFAILLFIYFDELKAASPV